MRRFNGHIIGVDHGSVLMFSDFEDGGDMWTGEGAREARRWIAFDDRYAAPPVVHVSMSMFDADHRHHFRADVTARGVTAEGFEILFRTWSDTRLARVRVDWTAIGEMASDEDWNVD